MLTKTRTYSFTVNGSHPFPFDMLRYDSCYPMDTTTANNMAASHDPSIKPEMREFNLLSKTPPTEGRWNSFLFGVKEVEFV